MVEFCYFSSFFVRFSRSKSKFIWCFWSSWIVFGLLDLDCFWSFWSGWLFSVLGYSMTSNSSIVSTAGQFLRCLSLSGYLLVLIISDFFWWLQKNLVELKTEYIKFGRFRQNWVILDRWWLSNLAIFGHFSSLTFFSWCGPPVIFSTGISGQSWSVTAMLNAYPQIWLLLVAFDQIWSFSAMFHLRCIIFGRLTPFSNMLDSNYLDCRHRTSRLRLYKFQRS